MGENDGVPMVFVSPDDVACASMRAGGEVCNDPRATPVYDRRNQRAYCCPNEAAAQGCFAFLERTSA